MVLGGLLLLGTFIFGPTIFLLDTSTASVVAALPFSLIMVGMCISLHRALQQELPRHPAPKKITEKAG